MSGLLKKAAAVVAAKEIYERVQEARQPKRSFLARISPVVIVAGIGGAAFWAYRNGKLDPVVEQAKGLAGGHEGNGSYPPPAPAAETGTTATGATSTASTI